MIFLLFLKAPVYCYQWFKETPQTSITDDDGLSSQGWEIVLRKLTFDLKQIGMEGIPFSPSSQMMQINIA